MKFLSVCSGIEAASVAWEPLGWKASGFSEIEPFPSAVLKHHYPDVPNHGDMTELPGKILRGEVEAPDLFCGGTPCQAFSVAGLRKSLDDARGNLSLTFCEIANAIDTIRNGRGEPPVIVFWENVPGVLNTKDNAFGCFLGELAGESCELQPAGGKWSNAGCVFGPKRAVAWRVLDAQYFGVAQRRRRVFVVASARNDFDPAAVLFEREGLRRDTAPSRETGQKPAGAAARGFGISRNNHEECVIAARMVAFGEYVDDGTASAMKARDYKDATDLVAQPIAFSAKDYGNDATNNLLPTLRSLGAYNANGGSQMAVCITGDVTHTLKAEGFDASEDGTGRGQPIVPAPIAWSEELTPSIDVAGTIQYGGQGGRHDGVMQTNMAVRRLTPVECERLQGFPDNYTNIPWRGKPESPDGPRYKALGNSWAVPVVRWIGRRIAEAVK